MTLTKVPTPTGEPRQVLILGANGRIGHLLQRVWGTGQAFGLVPRWQARRADALEGFASSHHVLDIVADPAALIEAAKGADTLLVLAGVTPAPERTSTDYAANTSVALAAVRAAAAAGVPRVLLASTSAVYGAAAEGPQGHTETGPVSPQNDYGQAKLDMENAARAAEASGVTVTSLRIGNVAGADQLLGPGPRAVTLDVFPDGAGPRRGYLGPRALAHILATLIRHPATLPPILNVSARRTVDMVDLLRAAEMPFETRPAPLSLPSEVRLDIRTLEDLVQLPPAHDQADVIVGDWREVSGVEDIT